MRNGLLHNLRTRLSGLTAGGSSSFLRDTRRGLDASAPQLGAEVCPDAQGVPARQTMRKLAGAALVALLILMPSRPALSLTPVQGDQIVNSAQLSASGTAIATASVTVSTAIPTPSTIDFLTYEPGATLYTVAPGAYRTGSDPTAPFTTMPSPQPAGATTTLDLSQPVPLAPATVFHGGEPIFVRVTAPDQNLDRTRADTIVVTITDTTTGDLEVIRLTETGPDTGVFIGYILSSVTGSATSNNGVLTVATASTVKATFTDAFNSSYSSSSAAVVDPYGIVFNSATGKPIDGATVTLIDVTTGKPATVFGDDGVSAFPATVTTGSTVSDASNRHYGFPPGGFRFPFITPGTYRLQVTSPSGYAPGASTVPDTTLQKLGAFALDPQGSRQLPFTVNPGPSVHIDIPLDPLSTGLWLQKTAGKDTVAPGDFIPYELDLLNTGASAATAITVTDTLPFGFRYRKGSTRRNGAASGDPAVSPDGRTLTFAVGDLAAAGTATLRYVVEVAAGARLGTATNQAAAVGGNGMASNLALASVQVRSDFLSSRSVLMGQVFAGACGTQAADGLNGVEGIRIFLEDGTFVDTDKRGMFHFEGVKPGTHVVQLDLDSLPEGYRVVPCEENSRFAGTSYSQFVDLQGGTLWRADFHLARKAERTAGATATPATHGEAGIELTSVLDGNTIEYRVKTFGAGAPLKDAALNVTLPQGSTYRKGSGSIDGAPLADPVTDGSGLSYRLGDTPADAARDIRFRVDLAPAGTSGELTATAQLSFAAQGTGRQTSPAVKNVVRRVSEENRLPVPDIVLHPHFATFGAELGAADRRELDDLGRRLEGLHIIQITVTGYTDNVRIARRSQGTYRDNDTLSRARAKNVGRYLIERLHLPPSQLTLSGMGEKQPVASNRTEKGRALNRRVEVRVLAEKVHETTRHELPQEQDGVRKVEIAVPAQPLLAKTGAAASPAKAQEKESGIRDKEGILSPADGAVMAQPIHAVRVCLSSLLTPHLFLDGTEVPAERIGFSMKDSATGKALYTYIGIDFGPQGAHTLQLKGTDPFGNARFTQSVTIRRSGDIAAIRLKSADGNIADGKTPIRLRLELLDAAGQVIPSGAELELRSGTLKPLKKEGAVPDAGSGKVERVKVDEQGNALFQPVNASGPYQVILGYNKVTLEAETYVKPKMRDWILVGLGEGTVGYNAVSGNMENLSGSGEDDHLYENGRVAFYAKGQVQGKWLLTMAYDSAKGKGDVGNPSLFQTIDPNTYYTLYGDATKQQYDASSARKLYLKIERDQFYALFGDFDTGLTVTELSRYSRKMNGLKAEWQGKNFEANVFGSDTAQAYVRDEIQGDGTSGLYHLSRKNIVLNSDTITIQTRDRFHSEVVVDSQVLSRFTDYSIDYDAGTVFFKQPVRSRDDNFNPIFIVVEYETLNAGSEALSYGGRVGAKLLDNKLKTGFTYVHEGQVSGDGNLYGLDALYKIGAGTTLKAEAARTDSNFGGTTREGNAWLAEVDHQSPKLQGKLYVREQEGGFGLGQQNGSETATRKMGADAAYKLTDTVSIGGQAYRQYNLATGGIEDVVEGKTSYTSGPYGAHLGFRHASDRLDDGSTKTSDQLTAGGSWQALNKRLNLHIDHDQSIGGNDNATFPTRTTFGADYKLTDKVTLFAQQEMTNGAGATTNTTSAGMKATPWEGGAVNTSMGQNLDENGERVFALFGLKQTWKISDKWSVDGGLDRSQSIIKPGNYQFNVNVPPASGASEDFTAVSVGTTYKELKWNVSSRLEVRTADSEDKWGGVAAFVGEPKEGWGWSARCQFFDTKSADGTSKATGDLRFGLVYRPLNTRWIVLDRLDFLYDREHGATATVTTTTTTAVSSLIDSRRVVNNLSANFKPDGKTQLSFLYGAKYVVESIDSGDYSGYTDLVGVEGRYDLTKEWDVGLRASVLHSWSAKQLSYSAGPSVGYNVIKNAWISLGYNITGFTDKDFSAGDYTAQGPFIRFRFKFDQNSVREAVSWINHE